MIWVVVVVAFFLFCIFSVLNSLVDQLKKLNKNLEPMATWYAGSIVEADVAAHEAAGRGDQ